MNEFAQQWLVTARELAANCLRRADILDDRLRGNWYRTDCEVEVAEEMSRLNAQISSCLAALEHVEEDSDGRIGATALLGERVSMPLRITVALLTAGAVCPVVAGNLKDAGSLVEAVCGEDISVGLTVREALVAGGALAPHVVMRPDETFQDWRHPRLKDAAFRTVVGASALAVESNG